MPHYILINDQSPSNRNYYHYRIHVPPKHSTTISLYICSLGIDRRTHFWCIWAKLLSGLEGPSRALQGKSISFSIISSRISIFYFLHPYFAMVTPLERNISTYRPSLQYHLFFLVQLLNEYWLKHNGLFLWDFYCLCRGYAGHPSSDTSLPIQSQSYRWSSFNFLVQ